ncbi:MAG: alginate export family protein, partial [Chitinophagaceae bacterium]|nr:alginate export family protein [Chitinophagaceae bacterium]
YYDFEGLYQSGHFGTKKISAWTISSNTSYNFRLLKLKTEAGLKAELISGDKKLDDGKLNSFNPLFPRGAYFGLASLIGPSNLADIHPSLSFELSQKAKWGIDYDVFWRYSKNDGIYAPNVALIYTGKNTEQRFIGQQYSTDLTYTPNQFLYFRAEFTWFKTGAYLKSVGSGKDMLFTGVTAQLKF